MAFSRPVIGKNAHRMATMPTTAYATEPLKPVTAPAATPAAKRSDAISTQKLLLCSDFITIFASCHTWTEKLNSI